MVEIVDLALMAVIDSFEIYAIHFLIRKENFNTNFIMTKDLLLLLLLLLLKELQGHVNNFI